MIRGGLSDLAQRAYLTLTRATLEKSDDSKKLQELRVKGMWGEDYQGIEHWHPTGMVNVPLPPDDKGEAEVLLAFVNGSRSHPIAIAVADRRSRPKDAEPGDVVLYDPRDNKRRVTFKKDKTIVVEGPAGAKIIHKVGDNVTMTTTDSYIEHKVGNTSSKLSADGLDVQNGYIKHNGKRIDAEHIHGGVVPGSGETAEPAN